MAPAASSSPKPNDDEFPIAEIVFSCAICQATVSDVYASTESNHGFHSGDGDDDGIVTKMWIAECSHVTCAKHLENGGMLRMSVSEHLGRLLTPMLQVAPFHPKGMQPLAPCPKCLRDNGDDNPKSLFSVRGLEDGEYDPTIPSQWLRCPAMKLDSSVEGMEAMRVSHYLGDITLVFVADSMLSVPVHGSWSLCSAN